MIHNDGVVLLTVIWIMTILSIMALSMSRTIRADITLTRYTVAKLRADALAWAGVLYSMDQIREDTQDKDSSQFDTMLACGIRLEDGQSLEEIFEKIALKGGYFDVGYRDMSGFQDEERKINLNAITIRNDSVLIHLIMLLGYGEEQARTIAVSVIDWHDADEAPDRPRSKNRPFENIEELLLVEGVSPEIYSRMKEFVTVFPVKALELKINPATASETVIRAVARSVAGSYGTAGLSDADNLARKMIDYRKGNDGQEGTPDDRRIGLNELGLNAGERSVFLMMNQFVTPVSRYFRVRVRGLEKTASVASTIEAVIDRDELAIASWRQGADL
jgi:type II secretory pathway component PulK